MDDRTLLERAARAAGIEIVGPVEKFIVQFDDRQKGGFIVLNERGGHSTWNPLTDDGDALRLAVKLGIAIQLHPAWVYARAVMPGDHFKWMEITEGWGHTKEPYTATRRAIVRAAASLAEGEAN